MTDEQARIPSPTDFTSFDRTGADFGLSLEVAGDELKRELPDLAEVLDAPKVRAEWEKYHELDPRADAARRDYMRDVTEAHKGALFASVLAALVLILAIVGPYFADWSGLFVWLFVILGSVAIVAAAWGKGSLERLRRDARGSRWLDSRARAEACRRAYFRQALARAGEDSARALLVFDFAVHFLLDHQIRWLGGKINRLGRRADVAAARIGTGVVAATALAGVGGLLGALHPSLALFAAFGGVATAFVNYWIHRDDVENSRANEERFFQLRLDLRMVRLEVPEVRARIHRGEPAAGRELVERVTALLQEEGTGWQSLAHQIDHKLKALELKLDGVLDGSAMRPAEEECEVY